MKVFTNKNYRLILLFLVLANFGFSQVYTNSLTTSICPSKAVDGSAPGWTTISNVTLNETLDNDFRKTKTGTIILTAPAGWQFNTAATLTLTLPGSTDLTTCTVAMTNSTTITISFVTDGNANQFDVITIAGIQVQALNTTSADGPIYCSGTTGFIPIGLVSGTQATGEQFAYLSQYPAANAGINQTICSATTTMAATNPSPGTGLWTLVSGTLSITSSTSYSTGITGIAAGTHTLQWSNSNCGGTTSQVVITRTTTPVANAGTDISMCYPNSTALGANFPPYGTGTWSILAGSQSTSTTQISSLNNESAVFTPTAAGSYTLQWAISLSGCTTTTDNVIVTVTPGPNSSVAGPSQTICVGSTATMASNTPTTSATASWSVVSGPSTLLTQFSSSTSQTAVFTPAGGSGTYVLAWTINKTGCTSTSTMAVVVKASPTAAAAGSDQSVCTTATLTANTPAVGTGSWTVVSGAGVFSNPTSPNSTYAPSTSGVANTIRWTTTNAPCASSSDDVVITATCIPTTTLTIPTNSTTTTVSLTGCPSTKVLTDNGGSAGDYIGDGDGTVKFVAPAGTCISYNFSAFATESGYDFLTIINGSVGSPTLGTYSGSTIPPSGITTSNTLTVVFNVDDIVQYAGFIMNVSCANACSAGSLSGGTSVANPTSRCSNYTTSLSISGGSSSDCGITYQWQASTTTTAAAAFSNITNGTAQTATSSVTGTKYFRCILSCSGSTVASSISTASIQAGGCGCPTSITLPYTATGKTTCGMGDDITSSNVTNVCGSTSYYTGEDVVYTFTPTATGLVTIDLASTGSWTGLMLYNGCPTSGGTCVANSQSSSGGKSLCQTLTSGVAYYLIIDSYASPTCNPFDLSISAPTGTTVACNMAYTAASATYSFEVFTGSELPTTDDVLFDVPINFGFPVCFDGTPFTGGYVASNTSLVFDAIQCFPNIQTSTIASGGVGTGYSISGPAPSATTSIPRNAVLAPWHDVNPGLGGLIQYATLGTAPNRRFIVSFEDIPMFSCGTSSPTIYHTSQIKLYETTNTIEIHVKKKAVCPGWNNGQAVLGLHNYNGTIYIPPVNATTHNAKAASPYNQWTMSTTAYKFTTSCGTTGACAIVLPVELKTFYGERVDKINHLYWETKLEDNLKVFQVERSTDGINFTPIGNVTPNNSPSKYHFEDKNAELGIINYYRVAVYEKNNTHSYTNIVGLSSGNEEILTVSQLYPNPTATSFMIGVDSKQKGKVTINVYDLFGKIVRTSSHDIHGGVNQYTIPTNELNSGIYYVEVLNNFEEIITKQKLVIQK